ncbi:hypothetical protein [Bradyrhizobium sp. 62]|uniref:hypothetical protein n=1 Tax=Bradyrhizobium sp. 62 TaxID=1043588 RepID=UPI001FFA8874|nr:hypothetical protein [Bradyrhizobium sp. 62]MCK1366381.1 hypothetical protein [Bradyrhizobium sp. 62]
MSESHHEGGELHKRGNIMGFDRIVGQDLLVEALRGHLSGGTSVGRHLAFFGGPGSGKKTIAKLYSQALICDSPMADGSPCGVCVECDGVRSGGNWAYVQIDASKQGDEETARTLVERDGTLNTAGVRIVLIDHAERLQAPAADAALKTLERETQTIFIFLVSDEQRFSGALRSRCNVFRMRPMEAREIVGHLAAACARDSIEHEVAALDVIAQAARGTYGTSLRMLAAVSGRGPLTLTNALTELGLAWGPAASHCYRALLAEQLDEALSAFESIGPDQPAGIRAMQAASLELELRHELGSNGVSAISPALAALSLSDWAQVEADLERARRRYEVDIGSLVRDAAQFWRDVRPGVPIALIFRRFFERLRGRVEQRCSAAL